MRAGSSISLARPEFLFRAAGAFCRQHCRPEFDFMHFALADESLGIVWPWLRLPALDAVGP
jgi:hypothetical protein